MRADLLAHVADGVEVDDGIDPIVTDAAELLRGDIVPQPRDGAAGELG